jgi:hypothetical protein
VLATSGRFTSDAVTWIESITTAAAGTGTYNAAFFDMAERNA